jgi:hypothetical protein
MEDRPESFDDTEVSGDCEAVRHLKDGIAEGKHWYMALLEAVGLWGETEETYKGRHYRYLIAGEAFDWLVLAERLLLEVDNLVPEKEKVELLFYGKAPVRLTNEEFRQLIGDAKYGAYLSYFYGVTVEEALLLAVEEKVHKEQNVYALDGNHIAELAYQQIYDAERDTLLRRFRREKGYRQRKSMALTELKEFTYWLFKYRLWNCDKERVASDTRMGLNELARQWYLKENGPGPSESIEA